MPSTHTYTKSLPCSDRLANAAASSCHWAVSRVTVAADRPAAEPEELLQRRAEVPAGQAMQVQQRQHLGHLRGLAGPRRQDRRGEPVPFPARLVDALVVDPR